MKVDSYLEGLKEEGGEASAGGFTLDRERARQKMRQFQLADPRRYVLELVQAAVLKGARRLRFDIDADDMRLRFDGERFGVADFDRLYTALFVRGDDEGTRALRQLALGLNAAMALGPKYVRVVSGDATGAAELELRPENPDEYAEAKNGPGDGWTTVVHVKSRFSGGVFSRFTQNLRGKLAEETILRERCRFAEVEVDLEGEVLSGGLVLPGGVAVTPVQDDGVRGVAGFEQAPGPAVVHLVRHGVHIATHTIEGSPPGGCAVVAGDHLRTDVSHSDIVRDARYEALVAAVRRAWTVAVGTVCDQLQAGAATVDQAWAGPLLRWALGQHTDLDDFDPAGGGLPWRLARAKSYPAPTGGAALTLADAIERARAGGRVYVVAAAPPDLAAESSEWRLELDEGPDAHLVAPAVADRRYLLDLFGRETVADGRSHYVRLKRGAQNRASWRRRPHAPSLAGASLRGMGIDVHPPDGAGGPELLHRAEQLWQRVTLEGAAGIGGELGLVGQAGPRVGDEPAYLLVVADGCLLCAVRGTLPLGPLAGVVAGRFAPSVDGSSPRRDATFVEGLRAVLGGIGDLYAQLARSTPASPAEQAMTSEYLRRYLEAVAPGTFVSRFLAAFGFTAAQADEIQSDWAARGSEGLGALDPAIAAAPLFARWEGPDLSFAELQTRVAGGDPLLWSRFAPRGRDASRVLRAGALEARRLAAMFPAAAVLPYGEHERLERTEAKFRARPTEELRLPGEVFAEAPFEVRGGGAAIAGRVGLARAFRGREHSRVSLYREQRPLAERVPQAEGVALEAVVSCDALRPNAAWDDVVDDETVTRVMRAVEVAAAEVVAHLARNLEHVGSGFRLPVEEGLRLELFDYVPDAAAAKRLADAMTAAGGDAARASAAYLAGDERGPAPAVAVDLARAGDLLFPSAAARGVGAARGVTGHAAALAALIEHLPVFRAQGGATLTLGALYRDWLAHGPIRFAVYAVAGLVPERPIVVAQGEELGLLLRFFGGGRAVAVNPAPGGTSEAALEAMEAVVAVDDAGAPIEYEDLPQVSARGAAEAVPLDVEAAPGAAIEGAPETPPAGAGSTGPLEPREARLLAALARRLRVAHGIDQSLLDQLLLRRLEFVDGDATRPAACTSDRVYLYRTHPLVAKALSDLDADPGLIYYLASAVYTAVNIHLEEVTDNHERDFLAALSAEVLAETFQA